MGRLQKNRRFNGRELRHHRQPPDGTATGWLSGGLNVLVVRAGATYEATHRRTGPAAEVRRLYHLRAQIAEVIRVGTDQRRVTGCQARAERAQLPHMTCCLVAFCVRERERYDRGLRLDQLKRRLSGQGQTFVLPALERLRSAA